MTHQTIIPPTDGVEPSFTYGSITSRFLAMIVDWFVVTVALFILFIPLFFLFLFGNVIVAPLLALLNLTLIPSSFMLVVCAHWIYFATMESSYRGATLGKRFFGLRVCDEHGHKLSFARASLRYFAKMVSAFPFMLGYVMAVLTQRKQALHDLIAETIVIKN
ncbi:MAG: RDD family protein [Alphaproteobacteria bacterium]|nr:RDD family protein [Alphaproteobacteria bacterium]